MAKKQAIVKETAAAAAPATSARAAKPKTPRVKAAQHSKTASSEPVSVQTSADNAEEIIARMAYGYWESRGCQGGSALEDWVRAEHEFRHRVGATRL
jgi:hypothetical protein